MKSIPFGLPAVHQNVFYGYETLIFEWHARPDAADGIQALEFILTK
jgi:hypothetical protein